VVRAGGGIHGISHASAYRSRVQRPLGASVMPADAAKRQPATQPVVERSASGTIIQPTTTIVPDGTGGARVIVIPRRRSYLDTGTEVSVGDRKFHDYYSWPGGEIRAGPTGSTAGTIKGPATIHCRGVTARRSTRGIRPTLAPVDLTI
jgi:hypothetical protein